MAKSDELYRLLIRMGYDEKFCRLISAQMGTEWTARRMIGYLRNMPQLKEEDIVDEMLAIMSDRDRIRQKHEMEYYQGKINEIYQGGLEDSEKPTDTERCK